MAGNAAINAHNLFPQGVPYAGVNKSGLGGGVLAESRLYWTTSRARPFRWCGRCEAATEAGAIACWGTHLWGGSCTAAPEIAANENTGGSGTPQALGVGRLGSFRGGGEQEWTVAGWTSATSRKTLATP